MLLHFELLNNKHVFASNHFTGTLNTIQLYSNYFSQITSEQDNLYYS